jgi:hypothetical protein
LSVKRASRFFVKSVYSKQLSYHTVALLFMVMSRHSTWSRRAQTHAIIFQNNTMLRLLIAMNPHYDEQYAIANRLVCA